MLDYPETISDLPHPLLALSMDSLVGLRYSIRLHLDKGTCAKSV